ncbi:MAG: 30S ribosomal protein S15 [bacterium]
MLKKENKIKIINKAKKHDTDTGSSEVQVALLTEKIAKLAEHLKDNRKDFHSRQGLLQMVADRRSHMKYLEKKGKKATEVVAKKAVVKKTSKTASKTK